jgi:hypothetical protein
VELIDRLWAKIRVGSFDECWPWIGTINDRGYGIVRVDGKLKKAHRVLWEEMNGTLEEGECVLHKCDNPPCCNPKHHFKGTKGDNNRDCANKGRNTGARNAPRGEASPKAKLSEEVVTQIRQRADEGESDLSIARDLKVPRSTVYTVRKRETWKHLEEV